MKANRNRRGALGVVLFLLVLLMGAVIGSVATEFAHMNAVKEELQNAVDAAALSGAQDLWIAPARCESDALDVLSKNSADGKKLTSQLSGLQTKVIVTTPVPPSIPGKVEVSCGLRVTHLLSSIFGRYSDIVWARGVAGTNGKIKTVFANQLFPLAINPNMVPPAELGGQAISNMKVGDTVRLYINSQKWKNAGWTSLKNFPASASYIDKAIEGLLGLQELPPGYVSSVDVGDSINLTNGVMSETSLGKSTELAALLNPNNPPLTFPLIDKQPPFNGAAQVLGFITIRPTNVLLGGQGGMVESLVGRIEYAQLKGLSGSNTNGLTSVEPGPVQLIE